jgi:hypothetical protein
VSEALSRDCSRGVYGQRERNCNRELPPRIRMGDGENAKEEPNSRTARAAQPRSITPGLAQ